jgi:hypothetical protein
LDWFRSGCGACGSSRGTGLDHKGTSEGPFDVPWDKACATEPPFDVNSAQANLDGIHGSFQEAVTQVLPARSDWRTEITLQGRLDAPVALGERLAVRGEGPRAESVQSGQGAG